MAVDIFAKIGDIKGESLDAKHKDEIEVLSWSWGVSQRRVDGARRRGRDRQGELPGFQLHAQRRQGDACPAVEAAPTACTSRKRRSPSARPARGSRNSCMFKLNDVIITGVTSAGWGDSAATENVAMQFAKVAIEYKPQKADGSLDAGVFFKYDVKASKSG